MKTIRTPGHGCVEPTAPPRRVTIGFVPTMGALHAGHRALIRAARLTCDAVVVSIFVNPTQFGPTEDLSKYPRHRGLDRALCRQEGVDVIFAPTAHAMYPPGFQTVVTVPALATALGRRGSPASFSRRGDRRHQAIVPGPPASGGLDRKIISKPPWSDNW